MIVQHNAPHHRAAANRSDYFERRGRRLRVHVVVMRLGDEVYGLVKGQIVKTTIVSVHPVNGTFRLVGDVPGSRGTWFQSVEHLVSTLSWKYMAQFANARNDYDKMKRCHDKMKTLVSAVQQFDA